MQGPAQTVPNPALANTQSKQVTDQSSSSVMLKEGKSGLRFGPVVTGQVALGKDGCGY